MTKRSWQNALAARPQHLLLAARALFQAGAQAGVGYNPCGGESSDISALSAMPAGTEVIAQSDDGFTVARRFSKRIHGFVYYGIAPATRTGRQYPLVVVIADGEQPRF